MSRRVYDNWQRLVEAVLRKQQMWDLFHAQSRSPSINSVSSDTSSTSSLDHRPQALDTSTSTLNYHRPHPSPDYTVSRSPFMDTVRSDEMLESRKQVEEEIMEILLHEDVIRIGIYGTGGIGKTTMAKRIGETMKREKIFDEVVMAVVGRQPVIEKIQSDIASTLGLTLEEKSLQVRARQLNIMLQNLSKVLIILDDVCGNLALEDVGILSGGEDKRFKIMFTSQDEDVLEAMLVGEAFQVQILSDDEAWGLFKERVGGKAEDIELQSVAKMLAKECKGLPLTLEILGLALKEKEKHFWEKALLELRCGGPSAYQPLELSYMWLSDEEKSLLTLCCMFKEDNSDIYLEDLVRFGMGLNIFNRVASLEEARSRVCTLTTVLKNLSLIQNGSDKVSVKMHDAVRKVAISIAAEDDHVYMINRYGRFISWAGKTLYEKHINLSLVSSVSIELAKGLVSPNLQFLAMDSYPNENPAEVNPLYVYIESPPSSLHLMPTLQTLHLHSCSVKNISIIGQLLNLEILSCYNCPEIEILPEEIARLNHLRLLELYRCQNLKTIVPGVISSLALLEELKMRESFAQWQTSSGQGIANATLIELRSLSRLVNLEVEVEDPKVIATWINPFPIVKNFHIKVGSEDKTSRHIEAAQPYSITEGRQNLHLSLSNESNPGHWIHDLLRLTDELTLTGNGLIILGFLENVKKFRYCHCSTRIHLLNSSNEGAFHVLELLDLENLTNLKEVCEGPLPVGSLLNLRTLRLYEMPALLHLWSNPDQNLVHFNLKSVDIRNCKVMPYLFTLSTAMSFVHLEELRILFCGMMKEVMLNDLNEPSAIVSFPTMKKLILNSLSSLMAFSKGIESMRFPQLQFLSITNLPKLKGLIQGDGSLAVFFNQKVEFDGLKELSLHGLSDTIRQIWSLKAPLSQFGRLEKLRICACNKLNNLFSPSIARALVSLKVLDINDSLMMAEVIVNVEEENEKIVFPTLERIIFWRLRSLRSFCQWKQDLELPSLSHVNICICPEMQTFTLGTLSTPKLQHFEVDNEFIEIKDLNRHFRMKHGQEASSSTARNTAVREQNMR